MKKSKKILLTIGIAFPLLASTPLVAAGCVKTNNPEAKPDDKKPGTTPEAKPDDKKPGTTPEVKPEDKKSEEQNLLEKRNKLIKETEAKWDDITKKIDEYSKDAIISKFPEFIQITDYLEYKKIELKDLKATKNNTIKLLVAKYFNILEAKILENKTFIENIIKNHNEIKEDSFSKTKLLLDQFKKAVLNEAKNQLNSALKHVLKINTKSFNFNQKFNFNKEYVRGLEAIKGNDLNAIKEITFKLNSFINLATSQKPKTAVQIENDVEGEVHKLNDLIEKLDDFVFEYVEETFNDIDEAGLISSIDNWIDMVKGFIEESKNPSESLYFKLEYLKSQTKTFYEQKMKSWANKVSDLLIEKGYDLLDKIAHIETYYGEKKMPMVESLAKYREELEKYLNKFANPDEINTAEEQLKLSKQLYDLITKIQKELGNEYNNEDLD
ncbi:variable surface lipoprotein [Metamycoplasma hominis]|uniref:variable surface lipoprotein n=1 Tax=Metamycoplasma hominis TaxID=2098 RepID=UPI001F415934|nr:variable surface lipoprotein [Metamycoplasma hominis]